MKNNLLSIKNIQFNKSGYDLFVDFLKAYSIICVVVAHCLPEQMYNYVLFQVWGDMQVPMFLLIQTLHAYKKETRPKLNLKKLLTRIIIPYIILQVVIIGTLCFKSLSNIWDTLKVIALSGGRGPGSYYFWIYLQFAILLPLIWPLFKWLSRKELLALFLIVSIGFEILFSLIDFQDWLYRLLAVRYFFLIYLGFTWVQDGIQINIKTIFLSILSVVMVLFFMFSNYDLEPIFYNTAWKTHRWICYFYVSNLMTYVLWLIYCVCSKIEWLHKSLSEIGKCSYEIYLVQMAVFVFLPLKKFDFIGNIYVQVVFWMLLTFILSLLLGIALKRIVIDNIYIKIHE